LALESPDDGPRQAAIRQPATLATAPSSAARPDIYFIVLDSYARGDVMRDLFEFDNSPFLEHLERAGFYIARQSTSNYCQTPLSLASTLNAVYLNDLIPATTHDRTQLTEWISDAAVVRALKGLGYQFVRFATGFPETDDPQADHYLSPVPRISPFHYMLLTRTPLARLLAPEGLHDGYLCSRERTLFLLETVPRIARWRQPTFTFAHVLAPHPPFVFGANGEDVSPHDRNYFLADGEFFRKYFADGSTYATGYRDQAIFITKQVERMIDGILANSPEPPLIILESDHGSGLRFDGTSVEQTDVRERLSNLNAYYLPGRGREALYPSISPVNTFRLVFNAYFGASLDRLPDRSYYSTWDDPFQFIDVTDQLRSQKTAERPSPRPRRRVRS
jgi:hypothetical protein